MTTDFPFPGLRSYRVDEADWFFGREGMSDAMAVKLASQRFLAVIGESGCGKSSLVRAGLLPTLQAGLLTEAGSRWRVVDMHPGSDPVGRLSLALNAAGLTQGADRETIERDPGAIAAARKNQPDGGNLLLLVDQFEELFRFQSHRDEKAAFLQLLLEAARQTESPVYVIVTMRSDFLGLCAQFRGLPERINEGQYLVPRMTRENMRQAIEGPVRLAGADIEPRLVQTLLNEVGSEPDQLPVLQHVLMRTWNNWLARNAPDDPVRADPDYLKTGGLQHALSNHADEALADAASVLGDTAEALARRVFVLLRDRDVNGQEVRRPTGVAEMMQVTGAPASGLRTLLEEFRKPGRTFVNASQDQWRDDAEFETAEYDVTHESFIRKWKRLRDQWIPDELNSRRIYVRLAHQALDSNPENPSYMDGAVLDHTLEWAEPPAAAHALRPTAAWAARYALDLGNPPPGQLFERAMAYLYASRDARDKRLRASEEASRTKTKKRLAYAGLVIALVGLSVVFFLYRRANNERKHANALAIASSALLSAQDPWHAARSALLAAESFRREPALLAGGVLSSSLALIPPALPPINHKDAAFVAYGPGGGQLATATKDGTILLWDSASGKTLATLRSSLPINDLLLLASGVLITTEEGTLQVLPLNRSPALTLCRDTSLVAASFNGQHVAAVCENKLLAAHLTAPDRSVVKSFALPSDDGLPDILAISDSGAWIASGSSSGPDVRLYASAGSPPPALLNAGSEVVDIGFTGQDEPIAVRQDGQVRRWWPSDTSRSDDSVLDGFARPEPAIRAGASGSVVVQTRGEGVFVWSVTGEPLAALNLAYEPEGFSAGGGELAVLAKGGLVRRWTLPPPIEPPFTRASAFFSPGGAWLVERSATRDQRYRLAQPSTRSSKVATGVTTGFYPLAFDAAGARVAVRANQASPPAPPLFSGLEIRSFSNGEIGAHPLFPAIREILPLSGVVFSVNGARLLAVGRTRDNKSSLRVWNAETAQFIGQQPISRDAGHFFAPDGKSVFWDDGRTLHAWTPSAGNPTEVTLAATGVRSQWTTLPALGLAACLVSIKSSEPGAPASQSVVVWRYPEWNEVARLESPAPAQRLAFSQDGARLVAASADGSIGIWDWQQNRLLASIPTGGPASAIAYTDDHRIAVLQAGRLKTYWYREEDLRRELCRLTGRTLSLAEWKGAQLDQQDFPKTQWCSAPSR